MSAVLTMTPALGASVLERWVEPGSTESAGTLLGLHGGDATHRQVLPLLRSLAEGRRLVAPRSARWSGLAAGGQFSWFSSLRPPEIEPIGFGDALAQLERFAGEYLELSCDRGTVLVGVDQGSTMALALAALWPELFAGVIAIGGGWPCVPGWQLPERDMGGMQILLVASAQSSRQQLELRHAELTVLASAESAELTNERSISAIRSWLSGVRRRVDAEESLCSQEP